MIETTDIPGIVDTLRYPVTTVASYLQTQFNSIFSRGADSFSRANSGGRAYKNTVRGIIIDREELDEPVPDLNKGYKFQFNPETLSDDKGTNYEVRPYLGLSYNDYIWVSGGERLLNFRLFMDNTPQSKTEYFNPTQTAKEIDKNVYHSSEGLSDYAKPLDFRYNGNAFSTRRVHERGILPEVEYIQSFLYPAALKGEKTPLFSEGGVISSNQFRPPKSVVLCLGPLYFEGVIKSAPVEYILFDQDLTPIRANVQITFAAYEFDNLTRKIQKNLF